MFHKMKVMKMTVMMFAHYESISCYRTVHFQMVNVVNFMLCYFTTIKFSLFKKITAVASVSLLNCSTENGPRSSSKK